MAAYRQSGIKPLDLVDRVYTNDQTERKETGMHEFVTKFIDVVLMLHGDAVTIYILATILRHVPILVISTCN